MKFTKNIGFLLLSIWLILTGLSGFAAGLAVLGPLMPILALLAGIFILIGR